MDKTLRRVTSHGEARADALREWLRTPAGDRFRAAMQITQELYEFKGMKELPRLRGQPLIGIRRPPR